MDSEEGKTIDCRQPHGFTDVIRVDAPSRQPPRAQVESRPRLHFLLRLATGSTAAAEAPRYIRRRLGRPSEVVERKLHSTQDAGLFIFFYQSFARAHTLNKTLFLTQCLGRTKLLRNFDL